MSRPKPWVLATKIFFVILTAFFISAGSALVWAVSLPIPDFNTYFEEINKQDSTKIYDRTGEVLLYDVQGEIYRGDTALSDISPHVKNASIAIEDQDFYGHGGIKISSLVRAVLVDIASGRAKQGGSTITQQVVKNTLLTRDKTITRKIKEIVLAIKMEGVMSKEQILELYLNGNPYGGQIYGIRDGALGFFRKLPSEITLAEAAYLAAVPQAPTYYSPYGLHRAELDQRKNLVLDRMVDLGAITAEEAAAAKKQEVTFAPPTFRGIKAPHFVFYVQDYLEEKYGREALESNGYKVVTTLDWSLQQTAEDTVFKYGGENLKNGSARNASLVALDPKTGQILALVGSRDYYDIANDGNFNVAVAGLRQPGSSFKPFVYAAGFNRGYPAETVLFDVPTEFNPTCPPETRTDKADECYMPVNYDNKYLGPLTVRSALAQSRNIPAVKFLYLVGINNALRLAREMGITTLKDSDAYGLTLVLGGGEVTLLEMTNAYGVFAADGVYHPHQNILRIEDKDGNVIEEYQEDAREVLPPNTARLISNILSDNQARVPTFALNSPLSFSERPVAVKTGTTNDYRDAWIVGYTPSLVVGTWAGNNDNSPMGRQVAGYVVAPMWRAFMDQVLKNQPAESFIPPEKADVDKPTLRGSWKTTDGIHNILYYIDRADPLGQKPLRPERDSQFKNWEYGVENWVRINGAVVADAPTEGEEETSETRERLTIRINTPEGGSSYQPDDTLRIRVTTIATQKIRQVDYYINNVLTATSKDDPYTVSLKLAEVETLKEESTLKAVLVTEDGRVEEDLVFFTIKP